MAQAEIYAIHNQANRQPKSGKGAASSRASSISVLEKGPIANSIVNIGDLCMLLCMAINTVVTEGQIGPSSFSATPDEMRAIKWGADTVRDSVDKLYSAVERE